MISKKDVRFKVNDKVETNERGKGFVASIDFRRTLPLEVWFDNGEKTFFHLNGNVREKDDFPILRLISRDKKKPKAKCTWQQTDIEDFLGVPK